MRLVYLTSARIPDDWGHVLQILNMSEAFAQVGVQVELVAPRRAKTMKTDPFVYAHMNPLFKITKVPCIDLFAGSQSTFLYWLRTLSFFISARTYLFFKKYDVLYTREVLAGIFFTSFFYEAHSGAYHQKWLRLLIRRSKGIVALTSFIREKFIQAGYPSNHIVIAPDAVRLERFTNIPTKENARIHYGVNPDSYIIGYSGTLKTFGKEKGVACTIHALVDLPVSVQVIVVGGEPEDIHEYKALAQKLYLSDRVRFFGKVPHRDIPDYLALFDVAVAPAPATEHSSFYGSPLKMFEYMAAGVPMIVSDLPALREVLSTETALFIKPADAHELAQAVSLLQREPARAQAMAIEARALVEKRFTWHARAQGILSLIQEVHG